jgi:MFS family permease
MKNRFSIGQLIVGLFSDRHGRRKKAAVHVAENKF